MASSMLAISNSAPYLTSLMSINVVIRIGVIDGFKNLIHFLASHNYMVMLTTIKHLFFACCQASYLILCRNVFEKKHHRRDQTFPSLLSMESL